MEIAEIKGRQTISAAMWKIALIGNIMKVRPPESSIVPGRALFKESRLCPCWLADIRAFVPADIAVLKNRRGLGRDPTRAHE